MLEWGLGTVEGLAALVVGLGLVVVAGWLGTRRQPTPDQPPASSSSSEAMHAPAPAPPPSDVRIPDPAPPRPDAGPVSDPVPTHSPTRQPTWIFLSAVTRDFGPERDVLRRRVAQTDEAVLHVQEDFGQPGHPTLVMLEDFVRRCAAVVHLVGPSEGAPPEPYTVRELLARYPELVGLPVVPEDPETLTYTQWEAVLALAFDKPLFVYRQADAALSPSQQAHLQRLRNHDLHPHPFASHDELATQVLAIVPKVVAAATRQRPSAMPAVGGDPVAIYRDRLRDELDQLPEVFRRGGERSLTDVFVDVRLTGELAEDPDALPARLQGWRSALPEGLGDGHRLSLADVLAWEGHRRWVLLGEPGSGKTTLLHRLGLQLLEQPDGPIPIPLRIARFAPGQGLAQRLPELGVDVAPHLHRAVAQGRAVLLLDGLDEHLEPAVAYRGVATIAAEAGDCPVFVASRVAGYRDRRLPGGFAELQLRPLEREQQQELLGRWIEDPAIVDETLDQMAGQPRLRRLIENPLLLTLVGLVRLRAGTVPRRRSELYEAAVRSLLAGEHRSAGGPTRELPAAWLVEEALGHLALQLHGQERFLTPVGDLVRTLQQTGTLATDLASAHAPWADLSRFLRDVAEVTGLLLPSPSLALAREYAFPHRSLREFFAARALAADIGQNGIGDVPEEALRGAMTGARDEAAVPEAPGALGVALRQARETPATWAEVLSLTCGRLGDGRADALVRRVAVEGSAELVARVVSEAEAIADDTVLAALGVQRGQEAWEARRDVLVQLPELVDDAEVVMNLLSRFAETTTHGADLWWVHHGLAELGEGRSGELVVDEDVRREARRRAAAFWPGHQRDARAAVLAELETRGWWKDIPEGTFQMGSPEDEAGRYDWEDPQHEVEVTAPFAMTAVTVTHGLYERFDPEHRSARGKGEGDDHPATNVTWYEAAAFASWLGVRLPTEVEWEYACRAGTTTRFWSGDDASDLAAVGWYLGNSDRHAHPVGELPANPWGLHDVHGNVWEWCADEWDAERYAAQARETPYRHHPTAPLPSSATGVRRVVRGGTFGDVPRLARSAYRNGDLPGYRFSVRGFRLVRASAPSA